MADETQAPTSPLAATKPESAAFGVSIRAWLAIMLTCTVCFLVIVGKPIESNFLANWAMVLAFYFADRNNPPSK